MASTGTDRNTGRLLKDWPHVVQSLGDIFTTSFGERVMRRYYGSMVPKVLGENLVTSTVVRFFAAIGVALLQEPRVALLKVTPLSVARDGRAGFQLDFDYRPRGHLGDFTSAGAKRVTMSGTTQNVVITDAST